MTTIVKKNNFKFPSRRLELIAKTIKKTKNLIDIGCDHAYISIYFAKQSKAQITATDISEKCLEKARNNAKKYNVEDEIKFVVSDGFKNITTDKITDCLIAGMGGEEIVRILKNKSQEIKIKNIYLQPATKVIYLKRYLINNNFKIIKDKIICDKGKFYTLLKITKGKQKLDEMQLNFGIHNLKKPSLEFQEYIEYNIKKIKSYLKNNKSSKLQKELMLYEKVKRGIKE